MRPVMTSARLGSVLAVSASFLALGCTARPGFSLGDDCALNTDCAAPLVCRLGRCRTECIESVDCGYGLECYYDTMISTTSGGCQLDDEHECNQNSDCPAGLVCTFATCTVQCVDDRDCAPDSACVVQASGNACVSTTNSCIYTSQCPAPLICGPEEICRLECRVDRDCVPPRTCDPTTFRCVL